MALTYPMSSGSAHNMLPRHKLFSQMTLVQLRDYQALTLRRDANTIAWWRRYTHPPVHGTIELSVRIQSTRFPRCLGARMPHAVCWHFQHRRWTLPLYRQTLRRLAAAQAAAAQPAHHDLWMCIHGHEAGDWQNPDTGHNGHYGGLQMHPGWYGGSGHLASSDSQATQEAAAEAGYRASGYSRAWLLGQWYHPDCVYRYG